MRWPFRRSKGLGDRVTARLSRIGAAWKTGIRRLNAARSRRRARRSFSLFGFRLGDKR
jgi:hypothetical protein